MLDFPKSTEFNKRIPKQKFYEKIDVSPALKKVFVRCSLNRLSLSIGEISLLNPH